MTEPNVKQIPLTCSVCFREFSGPIPAMQHFASADHKKKEEQSKTAGMGASFCHFCHIQCNTRQQYQEHIASPAHKIKEQKSQRFAPANGQPLNSQSNLSDGRLAAPNANRDYDFDGSRGYCYVCEIHLTSKAHANQHLNGANHRKAKNRKNIMNSGITTAHTDIVDKQNSTTSVEYFLDGGRGRCYICNIEFTSIQHAKDHLSGSKHRKAKSQRGISPCTFTSRETSPFNFMDNSVNPQHLVLDNKKPVHRQQENTPSSAHALYNREIKDSSYGMNNNEIRQGASEYGGMNNETRSTRNVESTETPDNNMDDSTDEVSYYFDGQTGYCKACEVIFTSKQNADDHLKGRKHKRIEELWKHGVSDLRNVGLYCKICMVPFTGPESAEEHFRSVKHQKKEAIEAQSADNSSTGGNVEINLNQSENYNDLNQYVQQPSNVNTVSGQEKSTSCDRTAEILCYNWNGLRGYCKPCKIDLTSKQHAQQHLAGGKHRKAELCWRQNMVGISESYCTVCKVNFREVESAEEHAESSSHLQNVMHREQKQYGTNIQTSAECSTVPATEISSEKLCYRWDGRRGFCIPCQIELTSEPHAKQHLGGVKHQKVESCWRQQKQSTSDLHCSTCLVGFTGVENAKQHYNSARHLQKVLSGERGQQHGTNVNQISTLNSARPSVHPDNYSCLTTPPDNAAENVFNSCSASLSTPLPTKPYTAGKDAYSCLTTESTVLSDTHPQNTAVNSSNPCLTTPTYTDPYSVLANNTSGKSGNILNTGSAHICSAGLDKYYTEITKEPCSTTLNTTLSSEQVPPSAAMTSDTNTNHLGDSILKSVPKGKSQPVSIGTQMEKLLVNAPSLHVGSLIDSIDINTDNSGRFSPNASNIQLEITNPSSGNSQQYSDKRNDELIINSPVSEKSSPDCKLIVNSSQNAVGVRNCSEEYGDTHDITELKMLAQNDFAVNTCNINNTVLDKRDKNDTALNNKKETVEVNTCLETDVNHTDLASSVPEQLLVSTTSTDALPLNITNNTSSQLLNNVDLKSVRKEQHSAIMKDNSNELSIASDNTTSSPSLCVNEILSEPKESPSLENSSVVNGGSEEISHEKTNETREEEVIFDDDSFNDSDLEDYIAQNLQENIVTETKLRNKSVSFEVEKTTDTLLPVPAKTAEVPNDFVLPNSNSSQVSDTENGQDTSEEKNKQTQTNKKCATEKHGEDTKEKNNSDTDCVDVDEKKCKTDDFDKLSDETKEQIPNSIKDVSSGGKTENEQQSARDSNINDRCGGISTAGNNTTEKSIETVPLKGVDSNDQKKVPPNEEPQSEEQFFSCQSQPVQPCSGNENEFEKTARDKQNNSEQSKVCVSSGTTESNTKITEPNGTDKTDNTASPSRNQDREGLDVQSEMDRETAGADIVRTKTTSTNGQENVNSTAPSCRPKQKNPYGSHFPYYCPTCDKPMNNKKSYDAHIDSKGHKNKVSNEKAPPGRNHRRQVHLLDSPGEIARSQTVKTPRSYQEELYSKTMSVQDSVCFLPTGTGKTLISCMVISTMLKQNPTKQVLFLVDKALLVIQQSKEIQEQTMFNPDGETKRMYNRFSLQDCESGDLEERSLEIAALCGGQQSTKTLPLWKHDIIVVTAAYCGNLLGDGVLHWSDFSLVVFDEAHHCRKKHPFNNLLQKYHLPSEPECRPKVMGLTASPAGQSTVQSTIDMLQTLLGNMGGAHLQKVEESREELNTYKSNAKVRLRVSNWNNEEMRFRTELQIYFVLLVLKLCQVSDLLTRCSVKDLGIKISNFKNPSNEEIRECAKNLTSEVTEYFLTFGDFEPKHGLYEKTDLKHLCEHARIICIALLSMEEAGIPFAVDEMKELLNPDFSASFDSLKMFELPYAPIQKLVMKYEGSIAKMIDNPSESDIKMMSTVSELYTILTSGSYVKWDKNVEYEGKPMVLVLVKLRNVAHLLRKIMQDIFDSREQNLKCVALVGHGGGTADGGMRVKRQKQTLHDINSGKYDIIFATPVCEEGVDISACEAVVSMHPPTNVTAMVQLRGRARKKDSFFIIMCKDDGEEQKFKELVQKESNMTKAAAVVIATSKKNRK